MIENTFYLLSQNLKITKKIKNIRQISTFFKKEFLLFVQGFLFLKIKIENVQKEFASKIY